MLIVPDDIPNQRAIFFANLETAIALVQDATPLIGERVAVIGAGIVGQLLARVLSQFPGIDLHVVDPNPDRRNQLSQLDCRVYGTISELPNNFDIMFEITGRSNLVNALFPHCTNDSRIIIGSWYGDHNNQIRLDTGFHRKRIRLISSQVSHINRDLMGRISKEQRYESVWKILKKLSLEELISHCVPFTKAPSTFQALAKNPHEFLQVCFDYSGGSDVSSGY